MILLSDFNFMLIKPTTVELIDKYRIVHASRYFSMPLLQKIECSEDFDKLIKNLKTMTYADLLRNTFIRHLNAESIDASGYCPFRLLSAAVFLMKFPIQTDSDNSESDFESDNSDNL